MMRLSGIFTGGGGIIGSSAATSSNISNSEENKGFKKHEAASTNAFHTLNIKHILSTAFIILLLVSLKLDLSEAARQNPLKNPRICGRPQCEPLSDKFKYGDSLYKYDYSAYIRTEFFGTGTNTSELHLKANLDLIFPKPCEGYLKINNVKLWDTFQEEKDENAGDDADSMSFDYEYGDAESTSEELLDPTEAFHPKSMEFEEALTAHLLRFAFHDGHIGEVCPNDDEPAWVLNLKKGILSSMQNTMLRFDVDFNTTETDVSGECDVQYSLDDAQNIFVTVKKVKDIASCRKRYSTESILQTTPYNFRDDKTIWPILDSESHCNMTIDGNIYKKIVCRERHLLIPFSNSSSGAVTLTESKLTLVSENSYSIGEFLAQYEDYITKRSTLAFDHTPLIKPTHGDIKVAREMLKEMCSYGFPNIQREFIDVFTNFLQITKPLDYKALTELLARAASICENGKNHVLESLPYIGSTASYKVMRDQIITNEVPAFLAHNWMTSLSFIQRPDEETLDTFYSILEHSKRLVDPEYTLGASAVIHNFCKYNDVCEDNLKVQRIINLMETEFLNIFNMFRGERRSRERMIVILKALGNIGVLSPDFADQLYEVIGEEGIAPIDIRLHSVLAFRRVNCLKYRPFFIKTYGNHSVNSEVRIASYLQAMRCPDYISISQIKGVLEDEEINQVGSFVWSHLKNLAKSNSPVRIEAQGLLLNDDLSDKFKMDIRKFSRNYEHSLFFDEYNFGTTTDLNVIFGTESFLPRSTTLNFTADLFGQSVNFFELSLRTEGFEELANHVFGPKGPLNQEFFRKKLSFLSRYLGNESSEDEDALDNILNMDNLRFKRDAENEDEDADEVLNMDKQDEDENDSDNEFTNDDYDSWGRIERPKRSSFDAENKKSQINDGIKRLGYKMKYDYSNPRAQFALRIFGNDLRFYSMEGIREVAKAFEEFNPIYRISKILEGKEFKYTKSRVFLDASYNAPLSIGIPLAIHAFGASSIDLRVSSSLDRINPASAWYFDVEGHFKPSVSVDLITTMQSDMYYAISGIKVKSNLYSNSEVEAKLKVRGPSLVSFSFNLPQDTNEIFSARSELLVMKHDDLIQQEGIESRRSNSTCTWPVLDKAIGLQMCSYFSVPDFTNSSDHIYPSLLLSGPLNFSIVLKKSDLSAKKYVFEYKWDQIENDTNWSLVFHTPGSTLERILVTNVTTNPDSFNSSVTFANGDTHASAGCSYDGNPDNRRLNLFLDTNGNRTLDLNMELIRIQDRNIWVYSPKMLLAVNGVNVTGLIGKVKINKKNGIMQSDFDLSFETKKLQALLRGNLVKSEITTSTNTTINYRFQANKIETINFEGQLVNTGEKSKTEYKGNMKLRTTAYPKLNFASNATLLTIQGHTEAILTHNNSPDFQDPNYTNMIRLAFARAQSEEMIWEGYKTKVVFAVKLPKRDVDFRTMIRHEERNKNGSVHNVLVAIRYAPEKEATGLFSVHLPLRSLFAIDAYMNITVPEFNSCTARLKLTERLLNDYNIFFNGSWFSGHSITTKGTYKDRSSRSQALHHLKLVIESPSFNATSLNIIYRRNLLIWLGDIQATYGEDPYALTLQYDRYADNHNANGKVHLKVKEKEYWINSEFLSQQPKKLLVEVHFDKLRDVHVQVNLLSLEKKKEVSLEFKWDANRDPSQRLGLLAELSKPAPKHYDGNFMVTYPDRTISCGFDGYTGGPRYYGSARASWTINDMITFRYNAGVLPGKTVNNWLHAELLTPFEGWHRNSIEAGIFSKDNLILANTSLLWSNDQNLNIGYKSDYELNEPLLRFDVRFNINSTINDIPTIGLKAKHKQDLQNYESELALHYKVLNDTLKIYSIKSNWLYLHNYKYQNLTGTIAMISPFEGYRRGGLAAQFMMNDQRQIQGAASLSFDVREFTLAMDGYVRKFTDNMLTINISTPLEKFQTINGRFGLNEKKRHAVTELRAPTGALGVEILCDINSLMDFDVLLSLATPIETFQQAAVFAKLKPDTVDMRGEFNNITLGFTGVWRYANITDFEYSYEVFTPLPDFKHTALIAKLINRDIFVMHLHGKIANYKLGGKINGHPKSKLLQQLGSNKIGLEVLNDEDFNPKPVDYDDDYDMSNLNYDEFFSYCVDFTFDTMKWPTIDGVLDIQEISDYYLTLGYVHLPQGRIDLKNVLYFLDYVNMQNVLTLQTPFQSIKDAKVIVEYHVDLNYTYFYDKMHFLVTNVEGKQSELGFYVNYTKTTDPLQPKQHDVVLNVRTPLEVLNEIHVVGHLELEENVYKGTISSKTEHTWISMAASVETEDNFLETSVGILLETNVIPHYACNAYFKKELSDTDNSIDIQFEVTDNGNVNKLEIETAWIKNPAQILNAKGKIRTTMLPLKLSETSILISKSPYPQLSFDFGLESQEGNRIAYGARANRKRDIFNIELWTPMRNYRNISLHGTLIKSTTNPNQYTVNGNLYRNLASYALNGIVSMEDDLPAAVRLRTQPKSGGRDGVIELTITKPTKQDRAFQFSAIEDGKMCQISGGYSVGPGSAMDFSVLVESTEPEISRINFNGKLVPKEQNNRYIGEVSLETPWYDLGIDSVKLNSDIVVRKTSGQLSGGYKIGKNIGRGSCIWSWILAENMQLILESYMERPDANPRIVHASAKYLNPEKNFRNLFGGGKLNVDSKWNLVVNTSVNYMSPDNCQLTLVTHLPEPVGDIHTLGAHYNGNIISNQLHDPNFFLEMKYESAQAQRKFLTTASYSNKTNWEGAGHVEWGIGKDLDIVDGAFEIRRKRKVRREFNAHFTTITKFLNEGTIALSGSYDLVQKLYHNVICAIDYPASQRVADVDVSFSTLANMYGSVNASTPFLNVSWVQVDFNFTTDGGDAYRFCEGSWPNDRAFFKLKSKYDAEADKRNLEGTIEAEMPLTTRHRADITYSLRAAENKDKGHFMVKFDESQVLDGQYIRITETENSWVIETTDISLENEMKPLGIHYVNRRDTENSKRSFDIKHIELFELRNTKNFNLTGELHSQIALNAQEFKIIAIHPNRTVTITTLYEEVNENEMKQHTKLELSPTAWVAYNIEVGNYTMAGNESQKFLLELSYPKRNLSSSGWYTMTDQRFNSDVAFKWTVDDGFGPEQKVISTSLIWQLEPLNKGDRDHQTFVFTLAHPLLEKKMTLNGSFYRGLADLLKTNLFIDYSNDPEHLIALGANLRDHFTSLGYTNYTFDFFAEHPASRIDVHLNGTLAARSSYYKTESHAVYKRDYYPDKVGQFIALLDLNKKEIEYLRVSPYRTVKLWAIPTISYPIYGLNATIWDTPDTNNTGYFYIDVLNKFTRMEINLTEDASQNLEMIGHIPDSRSGYLDAWRNYEEIRVIDISSYLKMNHSRLITGRFHWRPKIKDEIKEKFNAIGSSLYTSFSEGIDFWIKSLYSESTDAIAAVWDTVKEYNKPFLEDVSQLRVLENDLEDLRLFVNQSYEANDFYIKTVVNFTCTILDELAIRDHIESLPKIFTEIWQAMGESGKALRTSIVWLIETVKTTYDKILDAIGRFFHGDSLKYVSSLMEKAVEKYDKFAKDLHISFIKYVENLWNKFWSMMSNYWKSVLKRFEPHIFKIMSFIEDSAWKLSKEFFEFIYQKTNELAESPYFNQVSSFTQNAEHLYKDILSNDALTNIKKYSSIAWNFIKEKYFKLVPFGAELNEVFTEIFEEIKEIQKIEQIQFFVQKYHELINKMEWVAEELQLEHRLHQLYALLNNKIRHYAMNAIETADMYREAKTLFVFDPDLGIIDLEQKLPMSWHAFDETPKFEEIPEYKWLVKIQNLFSSTNSSMIRYIYNLRTHLDPKTWLPPYYSRALLIDTRHFLTFDKRFVDLNINTEPNRRPCSYLLAHDFFKNNFSLILEPKVNGLQARQVEVNRVIFLANGQLLEIDFIRDILTINGNSKPMLPNRMGGVSVHRDSDILTIHSDTEFTLSCNMQFDLCWFEMSGWYFGQSAGLLGTMNNEHFDEFTKSNGHFASNTIEFTDSWSLQHCKQKEITSKTEIPSNIIETCHSFFKSGIFSACTDTIDPMPFYEMCLDLGRTSTPIRDGHPAIKGACTAALAYIETCTSSKIPMRVPDQCVFCQLSNGTYIPEGTFVELNDNDVPRSTDVVFIIEAKPCNANITERKSIITITSVLEEQFQQYRITNNRYAVVAFGGDAPFDKPRTLLENNQDFVTNINDLEKYFTHIETYNGTYNDILQAISHASKLNFRAGVSKTFILLSCSNCASRYMRLDYASILQFMREEGVNLHILADTEFDFEKKRPFKHFFGLDKDLVYSKRHPEGDAEIRKNMTIPKSNLGSCTNLAMETGGSVFSARKLMPERKYPIRRLAAIFGKRVAKTAIPLAYQTCECSGHNSGVAYIACSPKASPDDRDDLDDYDLQFSDVGQWSDEDDMVI